MAQLRQDFQKFQARNVEIVVLGPEDQTSFKKYFEKEQLPFRGIPDPRGSVLKLYGQEVNLFKLGRMPAQVIIDTKGVIRFIHYGHSMSDIPQNDEILEILSFIDQS